MRTDAIAAELTQARTKGPLREIQIPPCPELLARLRAAMALREPDLSEVQAVASSDVAMGATLLRVANSPVHLGDGAPCVSVGQAMTRLGLMHTVSLMSSFLVRHALPVKSPHLQRFWERSHKRSVAMEFLAQRIPGMHAALASSHGLFCHVGMPVMLQQVRGYGATLVEAGARIDRPFVATEDANHRCNHAVVGALTVRAWGLPAVLMASVRLHHDFSVLGDAGVESEVQGLVATGLLADHLMRRHEGLSPDADWQQQGERVLDWLQLSATDLQEWGDLLEPLLDEVF
ncbi:MAG: HDOD domain-containing protein [Burkholderiales bacterium]|nr:HDOD domain-containing protein [Burkholderiales bacterium]